MSQGKSEALVMISPPEIRTKGAPISGPTLLSSSLITGRPFLVVESPILVLLVH